MSEQQEENKAAVVQSHLTVVLGINEPTSDELSRLWTAAIECEGIGGSSMETLYELYEARIKKFTWVGKRECDLRVALDRYLEHRGYKYPITTEIQYA